MAAGSLLAPGGSSPGDKTGPRSDIYSYSYPAYGGPGPVTGASTGRQDAIANPTPSREGVGGKGVWGGFVWSKAE